MLGSSVFTRSTNFGLASARCRLSSAKSRAVSTNFELRSADAGQVFTTSRLRSANFG